MAVFTFDNMGSSGGGSNRSWNYSDSDKPDFALQIDGTVVEMKQVQETQYQTNAPLFWKNDGSKVTKVTEDTGQPCLNFCIVIDTVQFGEKDWIFNPKTKKDYTIDPRTGRPKNPDGLSKASMALQDALVQAGMDAGNLDQLGGMSISVSTQEPPEGFTYGPTSPRPFGVRINGKGDKPFRGCFPFGQEPKAAPAPAPAMQPTPAQMHQTMEAAPRPQMGYGYPQYNSSYEQTPITAYADEYIPR